MSPAHTFVAEVRQEVVGFSDITADGPLDMLFVDPDHGRQGVARALVERVLSEARSLGCRRVVTHASRTARPAFQRLGFVVETENDDNWVRGQHLPNFTMRTDLADD